MKTYHLLTIVNLVLTGLLSLALIGVYLSVPDITDLSTRIYEAKVEDEQQSQLLSIHNDHFETIYGHLRTQQFPSR